MEIRKANLTFKNALSKRKTTTEIILHCSASKEGVDYTVNAVHNLHLKKGWSGIGYNYYIDIHGVIWEGRPEDCVGAHVSGHNSKSIGVCYCGGLDKNGKAKDTRNEKQLKSMIELCKYLHKKYPAATFHGHYEFDNKACPCFKVKDWIDSIDLDDKNVKPTVQTETQKPVTTQTTQTAKPSSGTNKDTGKLQTSICCNIISYLKRLFS